MWESVALVYHYKTTTRLLLQPQPLKISAVLHESPLPIIEGRGNTSGLTNNQVKPFIGVSGRGLLGDWGVRCFEEQGKQTLEGWRGGSCVGNYNNISLWGELDNLHI